MLGDLYKNQDLQYKYNLTLCKPNKDMMVRLPEKNNFEYIHKIYEPDEISFNLPSTTIDLSTHDTIRNPNYDLVRGDFLLYVEITDGEKLIENKYFVIDSAKDNGSENSDIKEVHANALEYKLAKQGNLTFSGTRMLYQPRIFYSFDNSVWVRYINPIDITSKTHIYVKTKDVTNSIDVLVDNDIVTINGKILGNSYCMIGFSVANSLLTLTRQGENAQGIMNVFEDDEDNNYTVGYVDPLISYETTYGQEHMKYRTFSIQQKNYQDFLQNEVKSAFDKIVYEFDTINEIINIYSIDNEKYGSKGFFISEKNYLKTINKEPQFNSIYTKLYVYGKDNAVVTSVSPTGQIYIEDYSYYQNNGYMSDSLSTAYTNYTNLLTSKKGQFGDYLTQKNTQNNLLATKETELGNLKTEMDLLKLEQDSKIHDSVDLTDINSRMASKQVEINSKQSEINAINTAIASIDTQIEVLRVLIDKKTNFTEAQLKELKKITYTKTWKNENYNADMVISLYDASVKALHDICSPVLNVSLTLGDLFDIIDCQYEWNKITEGSIISVHYTPFNLDIDLRLIKFTHKDGESLSVELSSVAQESNAIRYLTDGFSSMISSTSKLQQNDNIFDLSKMNGDFVSSIIENGLDSSKYQVLAGTNQGIKINENGILLSDITNPNEQMKIINNCLCLTTDGWTTASLAIRPDGICNEKILIKQLKGINKLQ